MLVAIAGGGIGGLTSAIALAARGFSVELFERAGALEEIGAGIQLSPNATNVLDRLGVLPGLLQKAWEPEALVIRDAGSGAELTRIALGAAARARYGAPYLTFHRADLQAGLLKAAQRASAITIRLGSEVRDVQSAENSVRFSAGEVRGQADVMVAADGIHSAIRTGFFGHPGPKSLGRSAWRAILPAETILDRASLNQVGLWLGPGGHLVHYPISDGGSLNLVVIAEGEASEPPAAPFGAQARRLIESATAWTRSPLAEADCRRSWVRGRVVLLGDAAHAMSPSAAQGGAQAIEDAWSLAAALSASPHNVPNALATHERYRRRRVERVARVSSQNLNIYEARGVPAFLRNSVLRILPTTRIASRLDWLFGFRPA